MELLSIKSRREDTLEGRAIVYTRISDQPANTFSACYVCTDRRDFAKKYGQEESVNIGRYIDDVLSKKELKGRNTADLVFVAELPVTIKDIDSPMEDIVRLQGQYLGDQSLETVLGAVRPYINLYRNQQKLDLASYDVVHIPTKVIVNTLEGKCYDQIPEMRRKSHMEIFYVGPILNDLKDGNNTSAKRKVWEFADFLENTEFHDDANAFAIYLTKKPDVELAELGFRKLVAIVTENYADAAFYRDEIAKKST